MLQFEMSSARHGANLVTDDKALLKEQVEALSGECVAALEALGEDRAMPAPGQCASSRLMRHTHHGSISVSTRKMSSDASSRSASSDGS